MDRKESIEFKQKLITALKASPPHERVLMHEEGKAMDLADKLTKMQTKKITVIVLER